MAPPLDGRRATLNPRESRACTGLLVLQLIVVALLMSIHYPGLVAKLGNKSSDALGARKLKRSLTSKVIIGAAAAAAAAPAPAAATVWEPRCQLPNDVLPHHGNKSYIDIAVSSEWDARARRDAIRMGYAAYARTIDISVRFFVGESEALDRKGLEERTREQAEFGDLVILPMSDTYENLTLKSMGMAVYTSKCGNGDFYVKTDDDVFVYPWRLKRRLEKVKIDSIMWKTKLGVYMGNFWVDSRPIRETWHKNYEPKWKGEHYNAYAAGPFYILSKGAVDFVGDNAIKLNWKWKNEDMAMGTWMVRGGEEREGDCAGCALAVLFASRPPPLPPLSPIARSGCRVSERLAHQDPQLEALRASPYRRALHRPPRGAGNRKLAPCPCEESLFPGPRGTQVVQRPR